MSSLRSASHALNALFNPRAVAIIGASTDAGKLSGRPLPNLLGSLYRGNTYVVHPLAETINGISCHRRIADVPEHVDAAIIVLPPDLAVGAAAECAEAGVTACIVGVSGFAEEATGAGIRRQNQLSEISRESGMRIVGPNTNGLYNGTLGISLGYNSAHASAFAPGAFSIISHSGALFSVLAGRMKQLDVGLAKFVSVGNECDLSMMDYAEYLILEDPETRVLGMVVESLSDGARFKVIAEEARKLNKYLVALKLGQSDEGAKATSAHSSRLAGSARAYQALFEESGVATVTSVESLVSAGRLLLERNAYLDTASLGLASITASGAASSIVADAASRLDIPMARFHEATIQTLQRLPCTAPVVNPVDLGAIGGTQHVREVFQTVSHDEGTGMVLVYAHILQTEATRVAVAQAVVDSRDASGKVHAVLAPGGLTGLEETLLRRARIPFFQDSTECFEAIKSFFTTASPLPQYTDAPVPITRRDLLENGGASLSEIDSGMLLSEVGIPVVRTVTVFSEVTAVAAAEAVGYPVVIKAIMPGVEHKSDLGLVMLSLSSAEEVRAAYRVVIRRAIKNGAGQSPSVIVQKMLSGGFETLIGLTTEPGIGQFLVVGLGGLFTEALHEVTLVPVPTTRERLDRRLANTALARVFTSSRWTPAVGLDEVIESLLNLQRLALATDGKLRAVDINPLWLGEAGVFALDALVIPVEADLPTETDAKQGRT